MLAGTSIQDDEGAWQVGLGISAGDALHLRVDAIGGVFGGDLEPLLRVMVLRKVPLLSL